MAKTTKHGLGNGLSALIPKEIDAELFKDATEKIHKLALNIIEPNYDQPRKHFDEESLKELAESIKKHGVLQPIVVSPAGKKYRLVAGERRWRAAKMAELTEIPAIVKTFEELERLEVAIIENVQRVDLSPLEQAASIEKLHQQFSMSYESIAKRLGKALSTVNNIARLLQLPPEATEALNKKIITEGHARAILSLKDHPEQQKHLLAGCINGWSVRQAERFAVSVKEGFKDSKQAQARVYEETPETKVLGKRLGTKVALKRMAKGGRLEITFKNDQDLKRIIDLID